MCCWTWYSIAAVTAFFQQSAQKKEQLPLEPSIRFGFAELIMLLFVKTFWVLVSNSEMTYKTTGFPCLRSEKLYSSPSLFLLLVLEIGYLIYLYYLNKKLEFRWKIYYASNFGRTIFKYHWSTSSSGSLGFPFLPISCVAISTTCCGYSNEI